jgi:hypothetical protein
MVLALTVFSAVLIVTAITAVIAYLIDRGLRREEDEEPLRRNVGQS